MQLHCQRLRPAPSLSSLNRAKSSGQLWVTLGAGRGSGRWGRGVIGGGCWAAGAQPTLVLAQGPLTLSTQELREWALSKGQMVDGPAPPPPTPQPPASSLLSYRPGCSPPQGGCRLAGRSHDPGCLVLRPPFFPSNQINKDSSVLRAPLPPASLSPHPCHEVTGRGCQEAGWPLLGLAAPLVSASLALSSFLPPLSPSCFFPLCHFVLPPFPAMCGPSLCPIPLASKLLAGPVLGRA